MITTVRAALAVAMLLGFYVAAFGIVVGLGFLTVLLFEFNLGLGAVKLGYVTLAVAVAVLVALWRVVRTKPQPQTGAVVTPDRAPQLWQTVRELAAVARTRPPDEIRLVPLVNASVAEDSRLLGLIGGRRRLYVGIPLMQTLTVTQLRSVLAHELGHYSRRHTRLGAVAYRGRQAIAATLDQVQGFAAFLLHQYAKLYVLVDVAVSRRQELEADELSARVAGRVTAQGTLREIPVVKAAWSLYERRYLGPGIESRLAPLPEDLFGRFGELLAARADDLARLRSQPAPSERSAWDTHPPISTRIAAMEALPESDVRLDQRPATELVPAFDQASADVALTVEFAGHTRLPWDEFRSSAMLAAQQRRVDVVYRAAARLTDGRGLSAVLEVVAAGRLGELAAEVISGATRREAMAMFGDVMEQLLGVAAVRSGAATWRHAWAGPSILVGLDGRPLDLSEVVGLALAPATVADARRRLAALGIDVEQAIVVDAVATAHGGRIVGGLANVEFNDLPHDLLILDNGLILAPCPKKTGGGKQRLTAFARSASVVELAERNLFVPLDEVVRVVVVKKSPIGVEVTLRAGKVLRISERWTGERLSGDSAKILRRVLRPYVVEPSEV